MSERGPAAIEVEGLHKSYRGLEVLRGIDLFVPRGSVLGLLGPNGAGKTTTVRVLSTLLRADRGRVLVAGFDAAAQAREVRRRLGLSGQYAAVDEELSGRENLVMLGRLLHLGRRRARERAVELLTRFDLAEAADRPARTYSGGMRRRLDLASTLVGRPEVIFLDEPTTGLDPASRLALWSTVEELTGEGVTVLLTTQYREEADALADRVSVIAEGRVVAEGTPDELKRKVGGERLEITVADPADLGSAYDVLRPLATGEVFRDERRGVLGLQPAEGMATVAAVAAALCDRGVAVTDFAHRRPSLDDVFLSLTGSSSS